MPADIRIKFGIVCVIRDQVANPLFKKGATHWSAFRLLAPASTSTSTKALGNSSQADPHEMVTTNDNTSSLATLA